MWEIWITKTVQRTDIRLESGEGVETDFTNIKERVKVDL
jgi:hypothetical protein